MTADSSRDREATCEHCWHQWGTASGGIGGDESWERGTKRCCHCGESKTYELHWHSAAKKHGPYYAEIRAHVV